MTDAADGMVLDSILEIKDKLWEMRSRQTGLTLEIDSVLKRIRLVQAGLEKEIRAVKCDTAWMKRAVQALLIHHDLAIVPGPPREDR